MSTKIFTAAALLAVASTASAAGTTIVNKCNFPAYVATSQGGSANTQPVEIAANGGSWSTGLSGDAICLKVSPQSDINSVAESDITQIEYSINSMLWYDASNINGSPYRKYGFTLVPSDPSCKTVVCAPSDDPNAQCTDAYNQPNDVDTLSCSSSASMTMNLCGAGGSAEGSSSGSSSSASHSSAAPIIPSVAVPNVLAEDAKQPATSAAAHTTAAPAAPAPSKAVAEAPKVSPKVEASTGHAVHIDANGDAYVEVEAEPVYVTTMVTVERREAEATAAPVVERHEHRHGHAHAHNAGHRRL